MRSVTASPSTASTASSSIPRSPSRRRTSTSAACTTGASPARPRRCSSVISPASSAAAIAGPRSGGHAPEAEPVREGEERRREPMAADVADLPSLLRPRGAHRPRQRPPAPRAAGIAPAVRADRVQRPVERAPSDRRRDRARAPRPGRRARSAGATRPRGSCRPGSTSAGASAVRRDVRRIRCTFTPASSARASSARATPSSRSEFVTALRPVHGPGCSSSRKRRAFGAVPARSSPSRSAMTEQESVT